MQILWVVNTVFPQLCEILNIQTPMSGSWMYSLAEEMSKRDDIELTVVTEYSGYSLIQKSIDNIRFYIIPKKCKENWGQVFDEVQPKLVHIHGSEYDLGYELMSQRPNGKYVLSVQGLVSICAEYYLAGLKPSEVIRNLTFRDIVKRDNLFQAREKFARRGNLEYDYFTKVNAVIGRTDWDRSHIWAINSKLKYFHCDEMLRKEFYNSEKWNYKNCEKQSIFISAANYPLKGFHQVLKAAHILKSAYPNLKIYVAGVNITSDESFKSKIKITGYGLYLKRLIKEFKLEKNIIFTGILSSDEMRKHYLKANIFICPSIIENSPNSVAEAQFLGTPVICSYVGGIPSLVQHNKTGYLYEFSEYVILANYIHQFFNNIEILNSLSSKSIEVAEIRHDKEIILNNLINAYNSLI